MTSVLRRDVRLFFSARFHCRTQVSSKMKRASRDGNDRGHVVTRAAAGKTARRPAPAKWSSGGLVKPLVVCKEQFGNSIGLPVIPSALYVEIRSVIFPVGRMKRPIMFKKV
jgi:hypothetical protein